MSARPPCRHCGGKKTVEVVVQGKTATRPCPACRGTGREGLVKK